MKLLCAATSAADRTKPVRNIRRERRFPTGSPLDTMFSTGLSRAAVRKSCSHDVQMEGGSFAAGPNMPYCFPPSFVHREMLQAVQQEIAERATFSSMDNALHCLFGEQSTPEQTYESASCASHTDYLVSPERPEVELLEGCHPDQQNAYLQEAYLQENTGDGQMLPAELAEIHHIVPDGTQEVSSEADVRADKTLVDVAAAARLAFNAERRKAGHARTALKCSSSISAVDTLPPPAKHAARKPSVPSFPVQRAKVHQVKEERYASDMSAPLPHRPTYHDSNTKSCSQKDVTKRTDTGGPSSGAQCSVSAEHEAMISCTAQALSRQLKGTSEQTGDNEGDGLGTDTVSEGGNDSAHSPPMEDSFNAASTARHDEAVTTESYVPTSAPVVAPENGLRRPLNVTADSRTGVPRSDNDTETVVSRLTDAGISPSVGSGDSASYVPPKHSQQDALSHTAQQSASSDELSQHADMPSSTAYKEHLLPDSDPYLVLEDSYAGSFASEISDTAADVLDDFVDERTSGADQYTRIALAKTDGAKMTLPPWSAFQAVAALSTDRVGHTAEVSSWEGLNGTTGSYLAGTCHQIHSEHAEAVQPQAGASNPSKGQKFGHKGRVISPDICQKAENSYKTGFLKRSNHNRHGCSSGLIKPLHGKALSSYAVEELVKAASPGNAKDAETYHLQEGDDETTSQQEEGSHSASLSTHSISNVVAHDLLPPIDTVFSKSGSTSRPPRQEATAVAQGQQPQFPIHVKSTEDSYQEGRSSACNAQAFSKQFAQSAQRTCSRERTQLHSPSSQTESTNLMKHSLSMEDLTRGNIPVLPQVYTTLFPSFLATLALYWKPPANTVRVPKDHEKVMRGEGSVVLLNDILDTALERLDIWCKQNQEHGEAFPDWADMTKGTGSRPGSNSSIRHVQYPGSSFPLDAARPPSRLCLSLSLPSLEAAAQQVPATGGPGWHYRSDNRLKDPFRLVAVPGWVPQLSNGLVKQKFFKIIAGEHPEVEDLVGGVLRDMGWIEDSDEDTSGSDRCGNGCHLWNLCWTWTVRAKVPESKLFAWQRINHFQECREPNFSRKKRVLLREEHALHIFVCRNLTRKDLLSHHLQRYASKFRNSRHADVFQCLPTTYVLPKEFDAFEQAFVQASKPAASSKHACPEQKAGLNIWIMKPSSLSRGRGIYLVDDISAAVCSQSSIVQRYVADPYLYEGYKFDLRLYVVVTSFNPLEAFLYKEGFARFALEVYTNDAKQRGNSFVHLTNSSIQEENPTSCRNLPQFLAADKYHKAGGSKMSLSRIWPLLQGQGLNMTQVWESLCSVTLAALYSAQDAIPSQATAFELYGVDAMLDQSGKVWLLEVNASPSLATSTPLDKEIKGELLRDVINLVDPVPFDRVALKHVLKRRQQQRTGPVRRSRRQGGGLLSGTEAEEREVLNTDLHAILKGAHPRVVGTMPQHMGKFQCIAPSPLLQQFHRSGN